MWIPSASISFHKCPLFQQHLKALRWPITKLKNQIYSSETKGDLLEKLLKYKIVPKLEEVCSLFPPFSDVPATMDKILNAF